MTFSNLEFAFFLLPALVLYWLLPRRAAWQNGWLLLCSYLFYISWNARMLPVLLLATAVDYFAALYIENNRESPRRMRLALWVSLIYNVGQLCFFKYVGFFAASLNRLFDGVGLHGSLPVLHVLLPLGISFFTFQKISYILDVYDGRLPACRSPLTFATFVAFFPQIAAGPIVRGGELLPQLDAPRRFDMDVLSAGVKIFLLGYFKKAYVADFLGQHVVDPIFAEQHLYSTAGHWLGLLCYGAQVFCDFSGYSEMAIGCGRLFGVELPENFNYPYLSTTLIEFWRRWHITLNRFLFDYIYGPLTTGETWLRGRLDLGFLIVFILSGLWHGAMMTFVVWGLLHAVALIISRRWDVYYRGLCRKDRRYVALRKSRPYVAVAWFLTQSFFLLTLVPFRATSLRRAGRFALALFTPHRGLALPTLAPPLRNLNILLCFTFLLVYHLLEVGRGQEVRARLLGLPPVVLGVLCGLVLAYLCVFLPFSSGTFIYVLF